MSLEWHYNKAQHRKGPMDGISDTIKNLVYRKVLPGDVVIDTLKKFDEFANEISNIDLLVLIERTVVEKT